jgi:putative tryptophan/tyrosine transport system substrate-binding protein
MRALLVFLLVALAAPAAAAEKVWRVGLLSMGYSRPPSGATTTWRGELLEILHIQGFELGRNLELVERYAEGHADQLPSLARELDATGTDVILATAQESVRAAMAATRSTPIVMVIGDDPVAVGIVASFARPGGRVTGVVFQTPEGDAKRLQLLSEAFPSGRRFGYLGMSFESGRKVEAVARAADQLGVVLTTRLVEGPAQYETAFEAMRKDGVAGVVIGENQPLSSDSARVVAVAGAEGLPTICGWEYMAHDGCVFAFGHDLAYGQRRAAEYVARILKGTAPSELPVERSEAWKLTINLKTARALGLSVPLSLLARADEVIE